MDSFLRKCLQLLKYAALIIAGSLYIWALIFLLKSDNWVGISALTTMLLAIAAFWTIWDRREREKRDRKERRSKEIIEWAVDVAKSGIEPDTPELSDDKDAAKSWPFLGGQVKKLDTLQLLMARGVYVEQIAQAINQSLKEAVEKVRQNLRDQSSNLSGYKDYVEAYKSQKVDMDTEYLRRRAQEVNAINILLYGNARSLIEKTAKVITID